MACMAFSHEYHIACYFRYPDGAWLKLVYIVLDDSSLHVENLFECEMIIPHTKYAVKRSTLYSPSKCSSVRCGPGKRNA